MHKLKNNRCANLSPFLASAFISAVAMVTSYFIVGETPIFPILCQLNICGRASRLTTPMDLYFSNSKRLPKGSRQVNTNSEAEKSQLTLHSSCQTQLTLLRHEEEVLAGDEWRAYDFGGAV